MGHPGVAPSEAPSGPWRSGNGRAIPGPPRAVAVTADTPVASLALMGQTSYFTLKEKVLDPAAPGSGLIALTCVCPRCSTAPAWPTLLTLSLKLSSPPLLPSHCLWGAGCVCL